MCRMNYGVLQPRQKARFLPVAPVSKQSWPSMENTWCLLFRFVMMVNTWFTLMGVFLWSAEINFMPSLSLHVHCKMCGTQKEASVNASQMIFNFSHVWILDVYCQANERVWVFCIYKIHVSFSGVGSYCLCQLAGRALRCRAFVSPGCCAGDPSCTPWAAGL